jgi:hypothetical protein
MDKFFSTLTHMQNADLFISSTIRHLLNLSCQIEGYYRGWMEKFWLSWSYQNLLVLLPWCKLHFEEPHASVAVRRCFEPYASSHASSCSCTSTRLEYCTLPKILLPSRIEPVIFGVLSKSVNRYTTLRSTNAAVPLSQKNVYLYYSCAEKYEPHHRTAYEHVRLVTVSLCKKEIIYQ